MGVHHDPSLEETLQWSRYPLDWTLKESMLKDEREAEELKRAAMQKNESMDEARADGNTATAGDGDNGLSDNDSRFKNNFQSERDATVTRRDSVTWDHNVSGSSAMSLSTEQETFPPCYPVDQPPPTRGTSVNGHRTPTYALAWVCPRDKLYENLGEGQPGIVNDRNIADIVAKRWSASDSGFSLAQMPVLGGDGNFYLITMYNDPVVNHLERVRDKFTDPLIEAARVALAVDQDLEKTLQWFRFPLDWLDKGAILQVNKQQLTVPPLSRPTKRNLFPLRKPVDEPPQRYKSLVDGHPTPLYVLAWVCSPDTFFDNLENGLPSETVDDRNFRNFVTEKWIGDFPYELSPLPLYAGGNYYLVAMFNKKASDHLRRIRERDIDPLIQAARVAFGVDNDPSLEATLQWFRFPLHWVSMEANLKYDREMDERVAAMKRKELMDNARADSDTGSTATSQSMV
ncbi:hypothetical protein B0H15DRAFT_801374 [Mycena belliarum]|uniref:Uncharacterized protein n=1 Tax=Mycena belliarum TaxID=1033014 RepID=A0AAD6U750_9AGAR|nr:hypothetical protein B0H15DRAFT_801374 [Mycena belliae]